MAVWLRRAGVLLHPTSLPGEGYSGDLGADARRFIEWMVEAGLSIWQVLPLGPTHEDGCPYQSVSAHAGNPDLIDLHWLVEQELLPAAAAREGLHSPTAKRRALDSAAERFFDELYSGATSALVDAYARFVEDAAYWLEDYVRFQAFRNAHGRQPWSSWPAELRDYQGRACDDFARQLAGELSRLRFRQFVFHLQWQELKSFANERGILLFGDMPIYVHLESADVWAHQDDFDLDEQGQPVTVTGVPPDYFSAEGQLWGNPQYHWERMRDSGFAWWLKRFESAAHMYDMVRIDHFRALEAYWEIPASASTALEGHWVQSPGAELLSLVKRDQPDLRLVAENLGIISPEVEALRHAFDLPGMLILQFAFDGNPDNPYLGHRHGEDEVVYTGTHDNNTTLGWFQSLDQDLAKKVCDYFQCTPGDMPWSAIAAALNSPARTAVIPLQDFLALDASHRMNTPGTTEGNWQWRFDWAQVPAGLARRTRRLVADSGRARG